MLLLKFLVAPVLTWWVCRVMEFPRDVANVLVVAAATPVGVLITIFRRRVQEQVGVHLDRGRDLDGAVATVCHRLDPGDADLLRDRRDGAGGAASVSSISCGAGRP